MKKIIVPIKGMHCRSCEIMVGENLQKIDGVKKADVSLAKKSAIIYATEPIAESRIQVAVEAAGYQVGKDDTPWLNRNPTVYRDVIIAIAIVIPLLVLADRAGLASTAVGSPVSQGVLIALLVGLTAGLSTCMALVGGLVLGLSARHAESHPEATRMQRFRPHLFFNASRIVAFFVLGGLMGLIGSVFQLGGMTLGVLMILVGVVMFLLGLQLTNIFPRLTSGGLTLPSGIARLLRIDTKKSAEYSHKNAMVLGAVSFFLPCGFTQAMQLYAISTGNFMAGALIMGLFAIGTAPGLLGVGGLASIVQGAFAQKFFKFAGVAVMAMALVNIGNGYTLTGWRNSFSRIGDSFSGIVSNISSIGEPDLSDATIIKTTFTNDPSVLNPALVGNIAPHNFEVKAGQKYALQIDAQADGVGCMSTIMIPGLVDKPQLVQAGKQYNLVFMADNPGSYPITCAMGLPFGKLIVT